MKIVLFRNGTWYSGLCLDEIEIKCENQMNIEEMHQQVYPLEQLGYEIDNHHNNPFCTTEQFEYRNEFDDRVIVRVDWEDKTILQVLKQYDKIENCNTTAEVIERLGALNKIFNDVVKIFRKEYGIQKEQEIGKGE
jgi:hypothetical protein